MQVAIAFFDTSEEIIISPSSLLAIIDTRDVTWLEIYRTQLVAITFFLRKSYRSILELLTLR